MGGFTGTVLLPISPYGRGRKVRLGASINHVKQRILLGKTTMDFLILRWTDLCAVIHSGNAGWGYTIRHRGICRRRARGRGRQMAPRCEQ